MSLKKFQKKKNLMYNKDSFFVEDEKMIIIKNKDILKILQNYKIQTYEGMADQVHFKDIYQILVKKAFKKQVYVKVHEADVKVNVKAIVCRTARDRSFYQP